MYQKSDWPRTPLQNEIPRGYPVSFESRGSGESGGVRESGIQARLTLTFLTKNNLWPFAQWRRRKFLWELKSSSSGKVLLVYTLCTCTHSLTARVTRWTLTVTAWSSFAPTGLALVLLLCVCLEIRNDTKFEIIFTKIVNFSKFL